MCNINKHLLGLHHCRFLNSNNFTLHGHKWLGLRILSHWENKIFYKFTRNFHNVKVEKAINSLDINKHAFTVSWQTFPSTTARLDQHFLTIHEAVSAITFLSHDPIHLSHIFLLHQIHRKVDKSKGTPGKREGFGIKCEMLCNFFFLLSVGEMGRHFDIKFVFLVKWLEASRAALGRCQI